MVDWNGKNECWVLYSWYSLVGFEVTTTAGRLPNNENDADSDRVRVDRVLVVVVVAVVVVDGNRVE